MKQHSTLFGTRDIMKMTALEGKGKVGLREHIKYVKDYRIRAQSMVQPEDNEDKSARRKKQKRSDSDSTHISSHAMFKSPRRFDDCRICGTLETMGDSGLYVHHISESVIGCFKFHAMSKDEIKDICFKAKICIRCCDGDVVFDSLCLHNRNCKVN